MIFIDASSLNFSNPDNIDICTKFIELKNIITLPIFKPIFNSGATKIIELNGFEQINTINDISKLKTKFNTYEELSTFSTRVISTSRYSATNFIVAVDNPKQASVLRVFIDDNRIPNEPY